MGHDWKNILVSKTEPLEEVIKIIDKEALRIALIVDDERKLLGTLSDGDIRRALISHVPLDSPVAKIMNTHPRVANMGDNRAKIMNLMEEFELIQIPIVDENNVLVDLHTLYDVVKTKKLDNPVFLMAGGFGTRLMPLTEACPKPLLKVGDKPILETILENFIESGFHNFYISTHYLADKIQDYFGDGSKWGVHITYVHEEEPLGTAGALGLLPDEAKHDDLILMNGDILTKVNFADFLDFHTNANSAASVCVREYTVKVPYGVINSEDGRIVEMVEKPMHKHFINAGIYALSPELVRSVVPGTKIDMPTLLSTYMANIEKGVAMFPIHEYWLDIGKMNDFEQAQIDYYTNMT